MCKNNEYGNPNHLFNTIQSRLNLRNDIELALTLGDAPSVISKMRHQKIPVGATMLLRLHEVSGISIKDLRSLMGDRQADSNATASQHQG